MNIYFDVEFTDFSINPKLISIGFISASGQEFYAELSDTFEEETCTEFVIENVLPILWGKDYEMNAETLAVKLKEWLESFVEPITLWSDAPSYDWPFIQEIFDQKKSVWPINLLRKCRSSLESASSLYDEAIEEYWWLNQSDGAVQHHALWDARSIRYAHQADK